MFPTNGINFARLLTMFQRPSGISVPQNPKHLFTTKQKGCPLFKGSPFVLSAPRNY